MGRAPLLQHVRRCNALLLRGSVSPARWQLSGAACCCSINLPIRPAASGL